MQDRETPEIEQSYMVFDSEDSRDAYFKRIEGDINAVELGDAVRHAGTTCLGFWGSEDDLFDDCSRIMLAEVCKHAGERFCRICDVQLSQIWCIIYNSARAKPRREMAAVCRELGEKNDNEALLEEAESLKTPVWLGDMPPYQAVHDDIRKKGTLPDAIQFIRPQRP